MRQINDSINPQRQSILESCDQSGSTNFLPYSPQYFQQTFDLDEFVSA